MNRINFFCEHKLSWENAMINSFGTGPFTPNKTLVNTIVHHFVKKVIIYSLSIIYISLVHIIN